MGHEKNNPSDEGWAMNGGADLIEPDRPIPSARGVLSAAEIEALLRPDLSDLPGSEQPETIEDKAIPALSEVAPEPVDEYNILAGQMAARLSLALGQSCGVKAAIGLREAKTVVASDLRLSQIE
ncbi:MAG: hypothetical protein AAFR74_05215, partial [Pseudomonadota bacterium]